MEKAYWEDLKVGAVFWGEEVECEPDEMAYFARKFDPQPMHFDESAAKALGLPAVLAPGAYTFALSSASMQSIVQGLAFLPGGLGLEMSFTAPVYAGDRLKLRVEILELRKSSKPGRGFAKLKSAFLNQSEQPVMEIENTWVIATRA